MSILNNMEFWAVIISLISLGVSLQPKIAAKIKGPKLEIEANSGISLSHKYGFTNIMWHLTILNTGGTELRIKKIAITLTHNNNVVEIPARTYFKTMESISPILLSPFKLKPGEDTSHNFCFFPILNRNEDRMIREIESKAKIETAPDETTDTPRPMQFQTFKQLQSIYLQNFALSHGEYQIELDIETSAAQADIHRKFRFTLFEGDEKDLRDTTAGYISGNGVCRAPTDIVWFNIPLTD
ncbi:hypothetical protein [Pseudomonas atacamensis]|uniref:hypothetical protein n=1 Tax=Pseudomonas atacamensis TaxID=2565368 RepID=UPI00381ED57A